MDSANLESRIDSPNPAERMAAIAELRHCSPGVAVPLLKRRMCDKEFIIRSLVAGGLGRQNTESAFEALITLIEYENDPNVRAEAANSLAKFGECSLPFLLNLFEQDTHWLVRQSILAAVSAFDHSEILLQLCQWGIADDDIFVQQAALAYLADLSGTSSEEGALAVLLPLATVESADIRAQVARSLGYFEHPEAKAALAELQHDKDHYVIGAALERLLLV
ncbi:HEAT repeat domain-containing protein [Synechocystis sp. LKSZ1]|uniref:HEAT repeat domain-containing protein n=1 Tax=Synechocystis sp. LKSZ1 TaxID=3144951 RepID=UPI00336C25C3